MANFFETVLTVLKSDERFVAEDGTFLRNAVYEAAMKMDAKLIRLLLENEETCTRFFTDVDGVKVFDKTGFAWVINNRQFLPDSYTRYKNRIGLADERGELISASGDVELVFPYKDCVLEGGQTKDEQKRSEIFYNGNLAPDQVDRLLYPKTLVNARKYENGIWNTVTEFEESDNLVIKGNNLIAISSLLKRYEGRVKCIYIDVPYNTGNDSFGYNDRFNHSTWLCFIKNRLEIARRLLSGNGTIAVSVDNYELAYISVLLDEIFGKENRKNIITVKRGSVTGAKVVNPGVVNIVEYVLLYAKDSKQWEPNRVYAAQGYDDRYGTYIDNIGEKPEEWEFTTVLEAFAKENGIKKSKLKSHFGSAYGEELEKFALSHVDKICRLASIDESNVSQQVRDLKRKSLSNPGQIVYMEREDGPYYVLNGNHLIFASKKLMKIDGKMTFSVPISDIWDDVLPNDLHNEGGVELKKGKKPEKLVARIVKLCTNEGDIVLDFFAGSGTTGAVALKMNRHFIICEQMDYIETITCDRLRNTVDGDSRGISADVDWQGGGSFVYCELAKLNQAVVEDIEAAADDETLAEIYERMMKSGFISYKVNPSDIEAAADDYADLSLDDKKRFLIEILDKNLLYVNYCDIDDEEFGVSEEDKAFTRSFYREG